MRHCPLARWLQDALLEAEFEGTLTLFQTAGPKGQHNSSQHLLADVGSLAATGSCLKNIDRHVVANHVCSLSARSETDDNRFRRTTWHAHSWELELP